MRTMDTPLDQAVRAATGTAGVGNGVAVLAAACGVSKQFVGKMRRQWRARGEPPRALRDHAPAIERACGGAVKAEALYPHVRWERDAVGRIVRYSVPVNAEE